ncbi:hypothetical protein BYT27DRAFT_6539162 [Phlegmacium glaucopus]|nr:hypothetical protein BYT27DRAFT_6539162 [Phlegmacium glaucopus]
MAAVTNLEFFSWTTCTDCGTDPKKAKEVKLVDVGPDALAPPWIFPKPTYNHSHLMPLRPFPHHHRMYHTHQGMRLLRRAKARNANETTTTMTMARRARPTKTGMM